MNKEYYQTLKEALEKVDDWEVWPDQIVHKTARIAFYTRLGWMNFSGSGGRLFCPIPFWKRRSLFRLACKVREAAIQKAFLGDVSQAFDAPI